MATSGRIESGVGNSSAFFFRWEFESNNIAGNFSTIRWYWGLRIGGGAYWGTNAVKAVSGYVNGGQAFGGATWSNLSGNGDKTLLQGKWNIGHNNDGNKVFSMSSTGNLYGYGNLSNSGQWALPTIPRQALLTNLSQDITDEDNAWFEFVNPAGFLTYTWFELPNNTGNNRYYQRVANSRETYSFDEGARNVFRQVLQNQNSAVIRYVLETSMPGNPVDIRDRTYYIKNDQGQANPLFSNFTFKDTNPATVAITGDDQYLIQGNSTLQIKVPVADKATARKMAVMRYYSFNIGGYSNNSDFSNTLDVTHDVGAVSSVSGLRDIGVSAVDSRGNNASTTKQVTILPYVPPEIVATATRANGYDDAIVLKINGNIAPLRIGSSDKNAVNATSGVQWRKALDGADISGVAWTNVASTQTAQTGAIAANNQSIIAAAQGSASATHSYQIQVKITDKLSVSIFNINVPIGSSIFRIGLDGYVYNNEVKIPTVDDLASAWLQADIGNGNATGYKEIVSVVQEGFTVTNATTLTVAKHGIYKINYQQLIHANEPVYLHLYVNNATAKYGFTPAGRQEDVGSSWIGELKVGDSIRLYQQGVSFTTWSQNHSTFNMFMIKPLPPVAPQFAIIEIDINEILLEIIATFLDSLVRTVKKVSKVSSDETNLA